ncbi:hypothetical protein JTE90_026070 [Oedothorax gibbosus]|uniref:Uncharacterized protein n=1 Tax=Oedothorax gibbosus TaxID=931172 RepID=A0AAV6TXM3_9ARAC|nr:hypothetical protein JTE90_026070 [Oedothorax gibbosus]
MSGELHGKENFLTQDHAVILPSLPHATSMDYIRAVATKIGAKQIHSIYRLDSFVKIYLKDKEYVRTVINSGVEVAGVLINVDFSSPPYSKVYLNNVDPAIPDSELLRLLGAYGTFESAIIHQKITGEHGFSHIESSSRVVYMKLIDGFKIPDKFSLVHGDVWKEIDLKVEMPLQPFKFSSSQTD